MTSTDIELVKLSKNYGSTPIVRAIDLTVPQGEFVSILGPSGCGKTTTLNMIAGFTAPTSGQIRVRGVDQNGVPPEKRRVGLVFQNYALFPHMTVKQNVGFGLRMQGKNQADIDAQVKKALHSVHLDGFEDRYPKELSGGQQQRTALARAIAPRPSLLLLDEPLSNLDLKLREAMRIELKDVQRELGITFVYVTHDQEEAMAMSDRIVVMQESVIAQVGTPSELYSTPRSTFVADFIGKSNIFAVTPTRAEAGIHHIEISGTGLELLAASPEPDQTEIAYCSIRPEAARWIEGRSRPDRPLNILPVEINKIVNLGAYLEVWCRHQSDTVIKSLISAARGAHLKPGVNIELTIEPAAIKLLSK
ncbi:MAG: ABC transporter ATP-binding protein [Kaiparowitsia implicata GSE-PSE-MK54-09C]|jgi:ABC-type Fe3+/spermidine/putrescine transport system ATPase subunit|nr:ABC transporter ATP-binding protein [Kaiparowitsia implicata GSE-PSE-MK54-09C]